MTVAEQRFMESVPMRLAFIEEHLKSMSESLVALTEIITKYIEYGH